MTDDTRSLVHTLVAEALGLDESELDRDRALAEVEGWDSLRQLNVMIAIEESAGVAMEPDDLPSMISVERISDLVDSRR